MAKNSSVNAVKVPKQVAQQVHDFLVKAGKLSRSLKVKRDENFVIFPVEKISESEKRQLKEISNQIEFVCEKFSKSAKRSSNLREILKGKLTKAELKKAAFGFDTVGDIAIIEIPPALEKKEKIIGNAILQLHKNIKTVCKKVGAHAGIYRLQKVKIIAGEKRKTANYKENGCRFKVTIDKVFFSVRLAAERLRIAKLIEPNETVAVLFAGVGPFAIVFAKNSQMQKAFAVELNPFAYKQMLENIKLNKCEDKIEAIHGDVRKVVPKMLAGKCDRVVMPLPKGGETFLREAIMCLKPSGGVIHFYQFVPRENPFEETIEKIKKVAKEMHKKVKILRKAKVREYSPAIIQIVVDFRVS